MYRPWLLRTAQPGRARAVPARGDLPHFDTLPPFYATHRRPLPQDHHRSMGRLPTRWSRLLERLRRRNRRADRHRRPLLHADELVLCGEAACGRAGLHGSAGTADRAYVCSAPSASDILGALPRTARLQVHGDPRQTWQRWRWRWRGGARHACLPRIPHRLAGQDSREYHHRSVERDLVDTEAAARCVWLSALRPGLARDRHHGGVRTRGRI